jgi:hypothetical protein
MKEINEKRRRETDHSRWPGINVQMFQKNDLKLGVSIREGVGGSWVWVGVGRCGWVWRCGCRDLIHNLTLTHPWNYLEDVGELLFEKGKRKEWRHDLFFIRYQSIWNQDRFQTIIFSIKIDHFRSRLTTILVWGWVSEWLRAKIPTWHFSSSRVLTTA